MIYLGQEKKKKPWGMIERDRAGQGPTSPPLPKLYGLQK